MGIRVSHDPSGIAVGNAAAKAGTLSGKENRRRYDQGVSLQQQQMADNRAAQAAGQQAKADSLAAQQESQDKNIAFQTEQNKISRDTAEQNRLDAIAAQQDFAATRQQQQLELQNNQAKLRENEFEAKEDAKYDWYTHLDEGKQEAVARRVKEYNEAQASINKTGSEKHYNQKIIDEAHEMNDAKFPDVAGINLKAIKKKQEAEQAAKEIPRMDINGENVPMKRDEHGNFSEWATKEIHSKLTLAKQKQVSDEHKDIREYETKQAELKVKVQDTASKSYEKNVASGKKTWDAGQKDYGKLMQDQAEAMSETGLTPVQKNQARVDAEAKYAQDNPYTPPAMPLAAADFGTQREMQGVIDGKRKIAQLNDEKIAKAQRELDYMNNQNWEMLQSERWQKLLAEKQQALETAKLNKTTEMEQYNLGIEQFKKSRNIQ